MVWESIQNDSSMIHKWFYLLTSDVFDQLCYRGVVSEWASCRLHVRQLRHKLLYFSHGFGIVAFLKDKKYHFTSWAINGFGIAAQKQNRTGMTETNLITTKGQSHSTP